MRTELSQNKYAAKRLQIILFQSLSKVWFSRQQCHHHLEASQTQSHPDESRGADTPGTGSATLRVNRDRGRF